MSYSGIPRHAHTPYSHTCTYKIKAIFKNTRLVARDCNPSSRVVEAGGSSQRKLISEPRVPARDPVSNNNMVGA